VRILRFLGVTAVVLLLALVALRFIPIDRLREPLNHRLSSAIGRPLRIDGDVRIEFDLAIRVEAEQVSLSDPPARAEFERVEIEFQLLPLLRGVFDVREVAVFDGEVRIDDREAPAAEGDAGLRPAHGARKDAPALSPIRMRAENVSVFHTNDAGLDTILDLDELVFEVRGPDTPIEAAGVGRIDGREFDVKASLGTPAALATAAGPFPVAVSGLIDRMEFTAEGGIADPAGFSGLDIALSLTAPSLGAIRAFRDEGLPEIGPVRAKARLIDADGQLGFEGVQIRIGDLDDPLVVTADGDLDDLDDLEEMVFRLTLEADDLPLIGEIINFELPPVGRVSLSGSFRGSAELIESEAFSLGLGDTIVMGTISGGFAPGRRPTLVAHFESSLLDLEDVGINRRDRTARPREPGEARSRANAPFRFDRLPELDARISIRADEIAGRADLMIDSLRAELVLTEDRLAVEELQVNYAGGAMRGSASIQTRRVPPVFNLNLDGKGVAIGRIMAQIEREPSLSGSLDADIDVTASGSSIREMRSSLTGNLRFLVRDGYARSSYANMLQGDLLEAAFGANAPDKFDAIRCLLGDIRANRGIAEIETLWFETDTTAIRAAGRFDLRSDRYDLKLTPTPKKRSLLSYAANVTITGPFSDPKVAPVAGSVSRSAVKGLIGGLLHRADPLLTPMMTPQLKELFLRRGGEAGPCAGFTPGS